MRRASADCVTADGARSYPTDEWGSLVLSPAISMVPIGPPSDHNYPARDPGALASVRLSPVLALEIPLSSGPTEDRPGSARADPADEC
jgi:hypothetical protein